jgi:Fe-S cluster assembly scaffold protein SufB
MFQDISNTTQEQYKIDTPGDHVFFFYNAQGKIEFAITNPKARLYVFGLFIKRDVQHSKLIIEQRHACRDAFSQIIVQSILYDAAQLELRGNLYIEKNGSGTQASFTNNNLLLGEKSFVSTQPALNILNHNVSCSHSATITKPNDQQLLYMQLRSLSRQQALELHVLGSIRSLFEKLNSLNIDPTHLIQQHFPENIKKTILQ